MWMTKPSPCGARLPPAPDQCCGKKAAAPTNRPSGPRGLVDAPNNAKLSAPDVQTRVLRNLLLSRYLRLFGLVCASMCHSDALLAAARQGVLDREPSVRRALSAEEDSTSFVIECSRRVLSVYGHELGLDDDIDRHLIDAVIGRPGPQPATHHIALHVLQGQFPLLREALFHSPPESPLPGPARSRSVDRASHSVWQLDVHSVLPIEPEYPLR